ncbi:hypothetical protein [Paenibacillus qinlingensis]|uniref:hypothetical protein n=1 Tax=Paenibacillus qinlingensis TaxID=1837343 RepID=UPI0015661AB7|nr:hypothetical protein [Paenibacillus qinlingensis]NQX62168.1 hypothetical protein [Paenibacillus qinlingensis]
MKYKLEFKEMFRNGETWICLVKTEDETDPHLWLTEQLNRQFPELDLKKDKILEWIKRIEK